MFGKVIAPVSITVISVFMELIYLGVYVVIIPWIWLKIIFAFIPLGFIGVSIYVLVERIQEIRSDEEDDLSKY